MNDVLLAHDVVEALALPLVDPLDAELPRLERAVTGGDDDRSRQVGPALLRRQRQELLAVLADALERLRLLAEDHLGAVLETLLDAEVDERLPEDLRVPGDVVDVLLRIGRRDLPAELLEALDDANRPVAVACVVGGSKAGRPRAEDRDVDDAVRLGSRRTC